MILLVDDDHAITQVLKELLTREGYAVRMAANGEDAYAILAEKGCRGVLLDMIMPGINGAGLLMLMSAEGMKVPVIIMAGAPDFTTDELGELPNVVGVLKKPFYPEEALSMIRQYMPKPKT